MTTMQQFKDYLQQSNIQDKDDCLANWLYNRQINENFRSDKATEILRMYGLTAKKFIEQAKQDITNKQFSKFNKLTYGDLTQDDYNYINYHFPDGLTQMEKDFVHLCRNTKYKVSLIVALVADKNNISTRKTYRELNKIKPHDISVEVFALRIRRDWLK